MLMSDTNRAILQRSTAEITPQGYTYAIEPNTTHPFWKSGGSDESNYIYADLKNPVIFENTDTNFTRFDAVLQGDVPFIAPLTLSLVSVTINSEVALPFVGVSHGDVAFLICEGISTNQLKVVGVYATTDMSELQITDIKSIPAPIKGDKGDNGKDGTNGVTPDVTATATVDQTTGNASVTVTKTGTETQPVFNFAFTGLKGERGETGQTGATGQQGATGADGKTPDITVIATVDETTGTPAVDVTKSGTAENPIFDFAFSGLKGENGGGGASEWKTKNDTADNIATFIQNNNIKDFVVYGDGELNEFTKNSLSSTEFVVFDMIGGNLVSRGTWSDVTFFPSIMFSAEVENNVVVGMKVSYNSETYGNGTQTGGENFVFDSFIPRNIGLSDFQITGKANNVCFYTTYTSSGYVGHLIGNGFSNYYVYVPSGNITIMYKE